MGFYIADSGAGWDPRQSLQKQSLQKQSLQNQRLQKQSFPQQQSLPKIAVWGSRSGVVLIYNIVWKQTRAPFPKPFPEFSRPFPAFPRPFPVFF